MTVMPAEEAAGAVAARAARKKAAGNAAKTAAPKKAPAAGRPDYRVDTTKGEFATSTHKMPAPKPDGTLRGANHALVAEFMVCFAVLGIGTVVPTPAGRPEEGVPHLVVKGSGLALLFFILALFSAGGPRARRGAAGIGALVTAGYLLTSSDAYNIFSWMTGFYAKPGTPGAGVPTAATSPELVTYNPAADYPWLTAGQKPAPAGPPAQVFA